MGSTSQLSQWSSILTLVVFLSTNLVVIFPIKILIPPFVSSAAYQLLSSLGVVRPEPKPFQRKLVYVHLNFLTVPLISVLLLLATKCLDGTDIRRGILGADGVKPINIMALFISLAYLSISLDATGLLRFLAFWVAKKGGSSGLKLYFYLYAFFLVCGVIVGNDPVILSGTVFLAYLTKISGITPPTAWIFAQFCAANMASVVLVSSNPTNLVLSGAFSISFTTYTAHLILPFLAASVLVFPVLLLSFRSRDFIPESIDISGVNGTMEPLSALIDRSGAIFGGSLLVVTLGVLVGTSTVGVPVWTVTVPPAVIMLCRDIYHDLSRPSRTNPSDQASEQEVGLQQLPTTPTSKIAPEGPQSSFSRAFKKLSAPSYYATRFPTVTTVCQRLPVSLLPFAFLMFILVQGLTTKGWVELLAKWWSYWAAKTGPAGAVAGMGFISCILCNICGTNIGATILAARVLQAWMTLSGDSIDPKTKDAAVYALALGSNFGAFTFTFSASLAGLLWRSILRQKGIQVRQWQFCKLNFPLVVTAMSVACAVLIGEIYIIHR